MRQPQNYGVKAVRTDAETKRKSLRSYIHLKIATRNTTTTTTATTTTVIIIIIIINYYYYQNTAISDIMATKKLKLKGHGTKSQIVAVLSLMQ